METQAENTPPAGETAPTEETPAVEAEGTTEEPAAEGDDASTVDSEKPAEGEEKPVEPKPIAEMTAEELSTALSAEQQMKLAHKFANKTMAAARRAEKANGEIKATNEQLTADLGVKNGFVDQMINDPMAALQRLPNWKGIKDFVQRCVGSAAAAEPQPKDEIAALRKRLDDRDAAISAREAEVQNQASQERVFAALEKEPDRFDVVLTDDGRTKLWNSIVAYRNAHGRVPNDKVFEMAEAIEERMTASLAKSKKFAQAQSVKTGDTAAANARPAASKTGAKTITNRSSSSGIVVRDYSKMTEKERDAAILADMYASGELTKS